MKIEYDEAKSEKNIAERGISFDAIREFMFATALVSQDTRKDYGEARYNALGLIGLRVHFLTFTIRGDSIRPISLRKANKREIKRYEQRH